jgi:hypothetical protein
MACCASASGINATDTVAASINTTTPLIVIRLKIVIALFIQTMIDG